jgi:hypothetical protein
MSPPKISLEKIFEECNEHLREMDKNRDRLIEFYLVLVGALLAAITTARLDPSSGTFLCGVVFLLGLVLAYTVTQYRLWHTRYAYTAMLLEAFGQSRHYRIREKLIRRVVRSELGMTAHRKLGMKSHRGASREQQRGFWSWLLHEVIRFPGTESATFQASLLIAAVPLYLWIGNMPPYPLFSILIIVLYILVANFFAALYLYLKQNDCPWATWLLNGLDPRWDFRFQKKRDWPNM